MITDFILQEHLFIVCELLRANLYEFHKYNRESGGEVYFTMARIQVPYNPLVVSTSCQACSAHKVYPYFDLLFSFQ
jgi:hypothetical protein